MALSSRDKAVAAVSNAIAVYSVAQARGEQEGASMYDFVLTSAPGDVRGDIDAELIDDIFGYIASARGGRD